MRIKPMQKIHALFVVDIVDIEQIHPNPKILIPFQQICIRFCSVQQHYNSTLPATSISG